MRRYCQIIVAVWFALSMTMAQASFSAAQTSAYPRSMPDETGSYSATSSDSSPDTAGYTPDQRESQALSDYLKNRKLPLVGAQVLRRTDGRRMVVLYGFVGSDFGKADAVKKARRYLQDSTAEVENRINIRPELLASNQPATGAANNPNAAAGSSSDSSVSPPPGTPAYPGPENYKAQQASPYTQQLTSMLPLIALLGVLGMGIAGGSSGFSFGSSPSAGSPYGSPYSSPFGNPYTSPSGPPNYGPYGRSPFGTSPYAGSPFGNAPYSPAPYPYP